MNTFRLPGIVILQQNLGLFDQGRFAGLVITVFCGLNCSNNLFWRNSIDLFGILPNKVLCASCDNVGPVTVRLEVLNDFDHGLVNQLRVRSIPTDVP